MDRILVAQFRQESHSFVPGLTTEADFEPVRRGHATLERVGNREMDGYLDAAEELEVELIPTIDVGSLSGPKVSDATFERYAGDITDAVRQNLGAFAGVMLGLHGAMVTESLDDAEGEILARVRDIVGPEIPIAGTFDLHTHMTKRMGEKADIIVGYQTCPHVDLRRTGRAAMDILIRTVRGEYRPVVAQRKVRMMTSSETHDDRRFPNKEVIDRLHAAEADPRVLAASVFCTQPWLDVTELGWTIVIVTDDNPGFGQEIADSIGRTAWDLRHDYIVNKMNVDEAIDTALAGQGVFALSEGADSTTGGGLGDGNLLLQALLRRHVDVPCAVMVCDPQAAAACAKAGIGATVTTELGGKLNPGFYTPLEVTGTVRVLTDGHYINHYGGVRPVEMGPTAVVQAGSILIMIPTRKPRMVDYQAYLSVGIDPTRVRIVQPKSAGAYLEYYEKIATCIDVDLPGPCGSDLTALPFTHIPRPMWPWDPDLAEPW